MKFLADMGISPRTVAHLQRVGHDAVHLHDEDALNRGAIVSVTEASIRVRLLPIQ